MARQQRGDTTQGAAIRRQPTPEQVWVAMARCYRTMSSQIERSFVDSGLSLTDFMILEALLHKGSLTITEIQAAALLASGSMTAAVDRLESRALIARTLSKQDRRARILELTAGGNAVIQQVYAQHSGQLKQWMGLLTSEERAITFSSLRKLERHLKAIDSDSPQ